MLNRSPQALLLVIVLLIVWLKRPAGDAPALQIRITKEKEMI
jgi:hypothetical protein